PTMAFSSINDPSRAVTAATVTGPAPSARAYPTSSASTCQPPPSVPANPTVRAPACPASGVDKAAHATDIPAMDRRTFLVLTGAASAQFAGPPPAPPSLPPPPPPPRQPPLRARRAPALVPVVR